MANVIVPKIHYEIQYVDIKDPNIWYSADALPGIPYEFPTLAIAKESFKEIVANYESNMYWRIVEVKKVVTVTAVESYFIYEGKAY